MRTLLSKIEDYPAHLEACWQEHLKPREPGAPTVISLFAGCGGSSLGYSNMMLPNTKKTCQEPITV
jgi:hypothetical protein